MKNAKMMVTFLFVHFRAHLDEIMALWLLRKWGTSLYDEIENSQTRYSRGDIRESAEELERQGVLCIGCNGSRYDEHSWKGRPVREGESATSLVAKDLKLDMVPAVSGLLTEITKGDLEGKVNPCQLGNLVKVRHRRHPKNPDKVFSWTVVAIEDLYRHEADPHHFNQAVGLLEVWGKLCAAKKFASTVAKDQVTFKLKYSEGNKHRSLTELARIFQVRQEQTANHAAVMVWVEEILQDLYDDQVEFISTVERFQRAEVFEIVTLQKAYDSRRVTKEGKAMEFEVREPVAVFRSDSELAHQASRSTKCGVNTILVLLKSSGHVQIFPDNRKDLDMGRLFNMLQELEYRRKQAVPQRDFWGFLKDGTDPVVPEWNFFRKAGMIFNSSITHPDVPVTKIPVGEIRYAIQHAFHPTAYKRWMREYGVNQSDPRPGGKSPQGQPEKVNEKQAQPRLETRGVQQNGHVSVGTTAFSELDKVLDSAVQTEVGQIVQQ